MEEVLVKANEKTELKRIFEVSAPTVRNALSGRSNTKLAQRIRRTAIERGGVLKPQNIAQNE